MAIVTQTCVGCKEQFTYVVKRGHKRQFCSKDCHSQSPQNKAVKKRYELSDKRKQSNNKYKKTDKGRASQKRYQQSEKGKLAYLKANQRRRAIRNNVFVEDVDIKGLLTLQGGVCSLCFQPISLDARWPDPMSLSLDHIVPLVNGGIHSYENCAATHHHCNLVKGVKSVEDVAPLLRLVS